MVRSVNVRSKKRIFVECICPSLRKHGGVLNVNRAENSNLYHSQSVGVGAASSGLPAIKAVFSYPSQT